jgi:Membrane-associated sensor, integral membrane domain
MMLQLRRSNRWLLVALGFTLAALLVWPVATVRWGDLPSVTPLVAGGLIVIQLSTGFLLFVRFIEDRRLSVLILGGAFTFSAMMAVGHLVTFPGAFAGFPRATGEATAWIFLGWRMGFALMCLAAVLVEARPADSSVWYRALSDSHPLWRLPFASAHAPGDRPVQPPECRPREVFPEFQRGLRNPRLAAPTPDHLQKEARGCEG